MPSVLTASSEIAKLLQPFRDDFLFYAPRCLKIRQKDGPVEPFRLNKAQLYLHKRLEEQLKEKGKIRALGLKGRQQGFSTYVEGRFYHKVSLGFGKRAGILTHQQASTDALFEMTKRFHDNCPEVLRPKTGASSAKELRFADLDSGYFVATAGSKGVGRGFGGVQYFHSSEAAFWPNAEEHFAGIMQTIPNARGTEVIIESTANGPGNLFYEMWQEAEGGKGEFIAVFVPWFWQEEYRLPLPEGFVLDAEEAEYSSVYGIDNHQMAWRRAKIRDEFRGDGALFDQEYPACIAAGTRIGTDRGILPIEDVRPGDVTAFGEVELAGCTGVKPVFKVTTEDGYSFTATADHRVKLTTADDFERVDALVGRDVTLAVPKFAHKECVVEWSHSTVFAGRCAVTADMGRFLGLFMGDGSFHADTLSIVCDAKDTDVVAESARLIEVVTGGVPSQRQTGSKKGCTEVRITREYLAAMFRQLGIIRPNGEGVKRIVKVPECIWNSPRHVVREFLRGLFEADGFAGYGYARVVLFSKHRAFLEDVQRLLLGFGVTCRLTTNQRRTATHEYTANELTLRREEAIEFGKRIGFLSSRKNGRVDEWELKANEKGRRRMPLTLDDKVVSVEPVGEMPVYDLTVPDTSRFDANGVVVHNCPALAFRRVAGSPLIDVALIEKARQCTVAEPRGRHLIGVDPAEYGDDDTGIAHRQGRVVHSIEGRHGQSQIETANYIARKFGHLREEAEVMVDCTGGYGSTIVDLLTEWGWSAHRVMFGEKATEDELYANRRTEIWCDMAAWYADSPCSIPDNMALVAQTGAPQYTYDSSRRKVLESKEKMRQRGVKSPDLADAVALTHAFKFPSDTNRTRGLDRARVKSSWRT